MRGTMATAKLRVNPESTAFEIDLPDDSGESGDYNPGEGAVIIAEDGTPYYVTFDEFDDTPPLQSNCLYRLVKVECDVFRDAELEFEEEEEEDDDVDTDDDEPEED